MALWLLCPVTSPVRQAYHHWLGTAASNDPHGILVRLIEQLVLRPGRDEGKITRRHLMSLYLLSCTGTNKEEAGSGSHVDDGILARIRDPIAGAVR